MVEKMEFNGYEYSGDIGQYQELKSSSVYQGEQYGISTVAFDLQEDLLWAGTYGVRKFVQSLVCYI